MTLPKIDFYENKHKAKSDSWMTSLPIKKIKKKFSCSAERGREIQDAVVKVTVS